MFDKDALNTIRETLLERGESVAVAESVTSGFLQASLSTVPDAAKFFQGGLTAYNLGQKYRHLFVNPIHAQACNCVSDQVAENMAVNVCPHFVSQWGLGTTGYASKVEEGDNKLFAHWAVAHNGTVVAHGRADASTEEGEAAQLFYVNTLLRAFAAQLKKE